MRAVVQRVSRASVAVDGNRVAEIGGGLLVLLGVAGTDGPEEAERLAGKVARLRIFAADDGRFDLSLLDVLGSALVVSQFTLIADSRRQKGTRPTSRRPRRPEVARAALRALLRGTARRGRARADRGLRSGMQVALVNDGPVTIVLDA